MKALLFVSLFVLFLAGFRVASANHYLGYKWGNSQVQNLTVYDGTRTQIIKDGISTAVTNWNLSPVVEMKIAPGSGDCTAKRGAIVVCERADCAGYGMNASLNNTKIVSVVITMSSGCGDDANFMIMAACQELGHALGLDHQETGTSCMATAGLYPDAHDYEELLLIY